MTPAREQAGQAPSEDDAAYLRAALKPFDPADRPLAATMTNSRSNAEENRSRRRRSGLLVATAAAAVAAALVLVPTLVLNRTTDTAQPQRNAAQDLTDCRQRAAADSTKDVTTGGASTPQTTPRPSVPWYSPTKAEQLNAVLRAALPTGTCVFPGSGSGELRFTDDSGTGFAHIDEAGTPGPTVSGTLVTPRGSGSLMVTLYRASAGPGSCASGDVDRTFTATDGTVVSQTYTYAKDDSTRWIVLLVQADRPDGSCVWLRLSDEVLRHDTDPSAEGTVASGATPMTMDELTALAITPGLDTTS